MIERKIGEIFFDGNVTLQVEESVSGLSCTGCYYDDITGCLLNREAAGSCMEALRSDHQFVIFK